MSYVYFLRPIGMAGPIKIGCSITPHDRLVTYTGWSPFPLELVCLLRGDLVLEGRFHAALMAHHSHREWFHPAPEVVALVEAVRVGTFDTSTLPPPRRPYANRDRDPVAAKAGAMTRRLTAMRDRGIPIPAEVDRAAHTYQCSPAEKARRRAIVREFVDAHGEAQAA